MRHKARTSVSGQTRHLTGRLIPIEETAQRCQYRRKNAKGGPASPCCEHSGRKRIVGQFVTAVVCFWCALDCEYKLKRDEGENLIDRRE